MVGCVLSQLKFSELYTLNSGKGRVREAGGIISRRMHGTFTKMVYYNYQQDELYHDWYIYICLRAKGYYILSWAGVCMFTCNLFNKTVYAVVKPLTAKLFNRNFHPLEVVSR